MIDIYGIAKAGMKLYMGYLDLTSYNLANVNSAGFKALLPMESSRGTWPVITTQGPAAIAVNNQLSVINDQRVGVLVLGNGYALMNPRAYFVVSDGQGRWLVRDGNFVADVNGHLTLSGLVVLNDKEQPATEADVEAGSLLMVEADTEQYERSSNGFIPRGNEKRLSSLEAGLLRGRTEVSNVDLGSEMLRLIVAQRAYQFASRAFRNADEMVENSLNMRGG